MKAALTCIAFILLHATLSSSPALGLKSSPLSDTGLQDPPAQTDFVLKEAIAFGIAHNPRLAAERERVNAVRGGLASARSLEPPIVNLGPSIGGEAATPIVTQKIEISGRRQARTSLAKNVLQVAQKLYDAAERDLTRDIEAVYADLVAVQSAVDVAADVAGVIRRIRDSVKKQVDVGQLPAQDLVKADIELSRAELEAVRNQNNLDRARFEFNAILGRPAALPARATEPTHFAPLAVELEPLTAEALAARPEIAAGEAAVKAARANVRLQRSELRPDLDVSLLGNTNLNSRDFMSPRTAGLGLALAFPLFDTGRIRGRVREAESEVRALEMNLLGTRLRVSQDVADAFSRVRTTETLVIRYQQEILPGAKDLLSKAEFGYGRGALTLLDFLEAQRTYKATQIEYLAALADNAKARADLDRAVGRRLAP